MKSIMGVIIIIVIGATFVGCAKQKITPVKEQKKDEVMVDRDYVSIIKKTADPYIFKISIIKVNKKASTQISGLPAVVDLTLTDSKGKIFTAEKWQDQKYAKEVGNIFSTLRKPGLQTVTGKLRLVKNDLPPGRYIVKPRIRIQEVFASIDYPAGNSVTIEVK
ncbi:MAG: hypothetical protein ABFD46_02745 [Armatimonadota bacterium]